MKRERASATVEEAFKGLLLSAEQRDALVPGLQEIRKEVLSYEGLAAASPNLKERLRELDLARTASVNLTKAFSTPFRNDLIEAMDVEVVLPRRIGRDRARRAQKRRSVLFLELLPVVKRYIDDMTADDICKHWDDDDRRAVNQRCINYETDAVLDLIQNVGFALDKPDRKTLELICRAFGYTSTKRCGISMARKRLAAWKTPGKQNVYAFHSG